MQQVYRVTALSKNCLRLIPDVMLLARRHMPMMQKPLNSEMQPTAASDSYKAGTTGADITPETGFHHY
jgi:hypothetical protein